MFNILPCPDGRGGCPQGSKGHLKMPDKGKLSDQGKSPYNGLRRVAALQQVAKVLQSEGLQKYGTHHRHV